MHKQTLTAWQRLISSLVGLLFASVAPQSSIAEEGPIIQRISNLHPIPLQRGANVIPDFNHDGRTGQIIKGWRDHGVIMHAYMLYLVLLPTKPGAEDWNVVSGVPGIVAGSDDVVTNYHHFGNDMLRDIRFVRARLDGEPATLLIVADRSDAETYGSPVKTWMRFYRIANGGGEPGKTRDYFLLVGEYRTEMQYCSAQSAFMTELGLAPSVWFADPESKTGC